jgi:hypothetical protein
MGTAWARRGMYELAFITLVSYLQILLRFSASLCMLQASVKLRKKEPFILTSGAYKDCEDQNIFGITI